MFIRFYHIILALLVFVNFPATALLIDDFADTNYYATNSTDGGSTPGIVGGEISSGSIVGGYRDNELVTYSPVQVPVDIVLGNLLLAAPGGADGYFTQLTLVWDNQFSTGLGGVDLTGPGFNSIGLIGELDLSTTVRFTLKDTNGSSATVSQTLSNSFAGTYGFFFDDFVGVDVTSIDLVKLEVYSTGSFDFSTSYVGSTWVPEPDWTGILCSFFLLAVLVLRRSCRINWGFLNSKS